MWHAWFDLWLWLLRLRFSCWHCRNRIASLTIVRADHHIGGNMNLREGEALRVNVIAKNALERVLPRPADLVVQLDGETLTAQEDLSYIVTKGGLLSATAGGVIVTEAIVAIPDNAIAKLEFVFAPDGTLTPIDVPVGA